MPKHRKVVLPLATKYYILARETKRENEQQHFLAFFNYKCCEAVVPMLLEDYFSSDTSGLTRWFISDCLYSICSKKYVSDYLNIVKNKQFGENRQMIVLLLGKLKEECAIATLVELLEDEEICLQAICALGYFKDEKFKPIFERFAASKHLGWRKYARAALRKLGN